MMVNGTICNIREPGHNTGLAYCPDEIHGRLCNFPRLTANPISLNLLIGGWRTYFGVPVTINGETLLTCYRVNGRPKG